MINVDRWQKRTQSGSSMIMQVHDELVFEVPKQEVEAASVAIKQAMESAVTLKVPLLVDIGVGDNWQQAH